MIAEVTPELLISIIFVSFVTGASALVGGVALIVFLVNEAKKLKASGLEVDHRMFRGCQLISAFAIIYGLFFFYRISYVMVKEADFTYHDWFLLDMLTGAFIVFCCFFVIFVLKSYITSFISK